MIVLGTQIFKREIRKFNANVRKELRKTLRHNAKEVKAKANVPVETGALKRSMKVRAMKRSRRRFGYRMVIQPAFYGGLLEFGFTFKGGRKYSPLRYLKDAGEREREPAYRDAREAMKAAIKSFRGRR